MILAKIRHFTIKYHFGLVIACSFLLFSCNKDKIVIQNIEKSQKYSNEELFRAIIFMSGEAANEIPEIKEQVALIKALNPTQENQLSLKKIQDKVISEINIQNPGYLNSFASSILSHDQERIKEEITKANDIVFISISKYFNINLTSNKSAKEEVLDIFQKKQQNIESLLTKYQLGSITKESFENSIIKLLDLDKTQLKSISTSIGNNPDPNLFGGCVAFLSFVGCNIAVAINIAGYINVVLAAAIAVAAAVAVFNWKYGPNNEIRTDSQLNYDNYINSIATNF